MTTERNKHTPGPWVVDGDETGLFIRMEKLKGVDEFLAIYASPNPKQREADARLIAAAPELLEALRAYQKANRLHNDTEAKLYSEAEAVLTRAVGKGG